MVRHVVILLLSLHLAHVPVPVPDLDGEWQGAAIGGLTDTNAWGFVLLGVRPNDDVDHGPIRQDRPGDRTDSDGSPFGVAVVTEAMPVSHGVVMMLLACPVGGPATPRAACDGASGRTCPRHDLAVIPLSRVAASRAMNCVWHV
jgi:hypothetical protein